MATKAEEANIAPIGNAGLVENDKADKQVDAAPTVEPAEKKVKETTDGIANLSVDDKEKSGETHTKDELPVAATEEEKKVTPAEPTPAAVAPTTESALSSSGPTWPETAPDHPLTKFYDSFEELVQKSGHDEVYGITLSKTAPFHTKLILQKFLRANQNDLEKAKQQLLETLEWRKTFDPTKAASETFDKARFGGLGYVLEVEGVPESANKKDVVTFNIYGAVKDKKATFGELESFLRWRVGLMEKSVQKLNLKDADKPIPNFGEGSDPYQGYQIHDYLQVSFLRQDPHVKAATAETIKVLGRYYPETLSRKFFVNVPIVMGWVYTAVKMVVAKETAKKFTVLSYGNQLATELGPNIPTVYGGKTGELEEVGEGMKFDA